MDPTGKVENKTCFSSKALLLFMTMKERIKTIGQVNRAEERAARGDYQQSFCGCQTQVQLRLQREHVVLENPEWQADFAGPVNYGDTRRWHFAIATIKDKPTKKWYHISIYRMESGTYELTTYVL